MKSNVLKKLFYPPSYLSLKAAGLDIRNSSIKYVEFFDKKGSMSVKNLGEIALPANTVKDGEILNKAALVKALAQLKNTLSYDFVRVSIPEEKTYIFNTQIPKVKDADIRSALEFKLEENVPLKAEEISFEYENLDKNNESDALSVNVSVIPKKTVENFAEALGLAGLTPLSFEMESQMVADAVIAGDDPKAYMIIYIKDDSTVFSFVSENIVRFTSTVPIGDSTIRESLVKIDPALYGANGKLNDDFFRAEANAPSDSFFALFNVFSVIKDEIEKFNDYLVSKSKDKSAALPASAGRIIFCGKSAALPGFVNHISQNLDHETALANVWVNAFDINDHVPTVQFRDSLDFAAAIGLAYGHDKK